MNISSFRICFFMMLQIMDKCNQAPDKVLCITDHPGFQSVALCPWNLQAVYNGYRQLYDNMPEKSLHEQGLVLKLKLRCSLNLSVCIIRLVLYFEMKLSEDCKYGEFYMLFYLSINYYVLCCQPAIVS